MTLMDEDASEMDSNGYAGCERFNSPHIMSLLLSSMGWTNMGEIYTHQTTGPTFQTSFMFTHVSPLL